MATVKCLVLLLVIFALCIEKHGVDANCDKFSIGDPEKKEFYSPDYPNNYPNNMNCELQLTAPIGYALRVEFHNFYLEAGNCGYDSLEIRDGNSSNSSFVGKYCGTNGPPVITSKGQQLYLIFRSDSSNTYAGFRASYTYQMNTKCANFSVGNPEKKEFYSPFYPSAYENNMYCELQLTAPENLVIRVEFHVFMLENSLECRNDYIEIKNGNSSRNTLIGKYCGGGRPPIITSNTSQLYLIFRSDNSNVYAGFRASYSFISTTRCNRFSIGDPEKKEFYSPLYPSNYENNMFCELQLTAPSGYTVRIEFHEFHLEPSRSCSMDHLEINEGNSTYHSFIGEYCGMSGPQPITSKGRYLYLRFKSDASNTYPGFRASYQFLENVECERFSKGDPKKKEFYSPFYPSNYGNNMNCNLQLTAPIGHMIRVEFRDFHLQTSRGCNSDYVLISEGNDNNNTFIGQYCGSSGPQPITSQGRNLFLSFKSDSSNTFPGFRASYQFVEDDRCKKFSIGDPEKKEFYSPYYPLEYHNNMNCELQLTAPEGHVVRIDFHEFNLVASTGCNLDYVQVNEGNSTRNTLIGEYCGKIGPKAIISEGRELYLKFKSDGSLTSSGFRASYQYLEEDESASMKRLLPRYRKHPRRN